MGAPLPLCLWSSAPDAHYMPPFERVRQGALALGHAYSEWAHLVDPERLSLDHPADTVAGQIAAAFAWPETPDEELPMRTYRALGIHPEDETSLVYHGLAPWPADTPGDREALLVAWIAYVRAWRCL